MSDIKTFIHLDPGYDPKKDWIQVEKIEKDKKTKEELLLKEATKKKPEVILFAGNILHAIKALNFLATIRAKTGAHLIDSVEQLIKVLDELKKTLRQLTLEDVSYDSDFVQHFSDAWHALLNGSNTLEWWNKKTEEKKRIKKIIDNIRLYPPKEEYTLGFYLIEFTGKDWLPFPFMHLLHNLHEEYGTLKEKSQLALWISEIDSIIKLIPFTKNKDTF